MAKHRRGPWSQAEDSYLLQLVQTQGAHNWVRIAQMIQSRSPKQCRERYHQNLKPSLNLNPISPEEGALIERLVAEMGKRWAEIARRLNGRSDNAVKNWWNGGMNRRKRLDNRRADAAARSAHLPVQRHAYQEPQAPNPAAPQQIPPPSFDEYAQRAPPPVQHAQSRFQQPGLPPAIVTSNVRYPAPHRFIDTPLPSPSAISNFSRHGSVDGGPPSLISDLSSYSVYTQSPNTPPAATELPRLAAIPGERGNSLNAPHYPTHGQSWAYATESQPQFKEPPQNTFQSPYYSYPVQEQWKEHRTPVLLSQNGRNSEQLPLPSFNTVAAPEARSSGLLSPPRDSRMSLRNVMD